MPLIGSLFNSQFDPNDVQNDLIGTSAGLLDPRQRLTDTDVRTRRKKAKARRRHGEFKPLEPGQELELRGFNEFQDARRRGKQATDSLVGESEQRGLASALAKSSADANAASDVTEGSLARRQSSLGLRLSDRQKRSQSRRLGLSRAINKASGTNATRRDFARNAEAAQRGGVGLENDVFNAENAGLLQLSNAAGAEKQALDNKKAERASSKAGILGTVVGIGASFFSSEELKFDKRPETNLLSKLKDIRVDKWKYNGDQTDHIGPYAEEFNETFGTGREDKHKISVIDILGVTLGAVKELSEQVNGQ
jgi:hypothetical protein